MNAPVSALPNSDDVILVFMTNGLAGTDFKAALKASGGSLDQLIGHLAEAAEMASHLFVTATKMARCQFPAGFCTEVFEAFGVWYGQQLKLHPGVPVSLPEYTAKLATLMINFIGSSDRQKAKLLSSIFANIYGEAVLPDSACKKARLSMPELESDAVPA